MLFDHQSNDLDSTFYITCNATCLTDIDNACIFVQQESRKALISLTYCGSVVALGCKEDEAVNLSPNDNEIVKNGNCQ